MTDFQGEFLGTMVLILLGDGVVAGVLLGKSKAQNAGWLAITAGWAFAVMAGVYTARATGAPGYINPAGVLAGAVLGTVTPERIGPLVAGEFLGAFTGAVLVWLHYLPHWGETADPGPRVRTPDRVTAISSHHHPATHHDPKYLFSFSFPALFAIQE